MWSAKLIQLYLAFYRGYDWIWSTIFSTINRVMFIYYLDDNHIKNITMHYYFNYGLDKYKTGTYYTKILNKYGSNHITYTGELSELSKIEPVYTEETPPPRRKQVLLIKEDKPVEVDLAIIDNYKINTENIDNSITNMRKILDLIGIDCTHINIIQLFPFSSKTIEPEKVEIHDLYH